MTTDVSARDWHIVTCEYPPQIGGVADYTRVMAMALGAAGHPTHVWCPGSDATAADAAGVVVHRFAEGFGVADLWRLGAGLNRFAGPRRIFVQWVPHGYGFHSGNLAFAWWLAWRAWGRGDDLQVMIHEPFIELSAKPTHAAMGLVHRLMLALVCSGATRVWLSIPSWTRRVRPFVPARVPIQWLPIPAPAFAAPVGAAVAAVRANLLASDGMLIGHFGTFSPLITPLLERALDRVLERSRAHVLLIGRDSDRFRDRYVAGRPADAARVHATGVAAPESITTQIAACDVMLQPYPDGISGRRTSALLLMTLERPIATNAGHLTEPFWREQRAVALAASPDGTAIADAALALLADRPERERLGHAASDFYNRAFAVAHSVAALEHHDTSMSHPEHAESPVLR